MSDSLPTISADQLTKAVCLAAAGTLSALDVENSEDEWQNGVCSPVSVPAKKSEVASSSASSLKLLESLSTSVTSNLSRLSQLEVNKPTPASLPYPSRKPKQSFNKPKKLEESSQGVFKKYSSRKNYKLLPPLIPSQMRANLRKPGPKTVLQQQLVTLSHRPNFCSPQELKSMPVRPARYTTNYFFVRATQPVMTATTSSEPVGALSENLTPPKSSSSVSSLTVNSPPVASSPSTRVSVQSQILLPFTPNLIASKHIQPGSQTTPSSKNKTQLSHIIPLPQPVFRLPVALANVQSKSSLSAVPISKENSIIIIQDVKNTSQSEVSVNQGQSSPNSSKNITQQSSDNAGIVQHIVTPAKPVLLPVSKSKCELNLPSSTASLVSSGFGQQASYLSTSCSTRTPSILSKPSCTSNNSNVTSGAIISNHHSASSIVHNILASPGKLIIANSNVQLGTPSSSVESTGTTKSNQLFVSSNSQPSPGSADNQGIFPIANSGTRSANAVKSSSFFENFAKPQAILSSKNETDPNFVSFKSTMSPPVTQRLQTEDSTSKTVQNPYVKSTAQSVWLTAKSVPENCKTVPELPKPITATVINIPSSGPRNLTENPKPGHSLSDLPTPAQVSTQSATSALLQRKLATNPPMSTQIMPQNLMSSCKPVMQLAQSVSGEGSKSYQAIPSVTATLTVTLQAVSPSLSTTVAAQLMRKKASATTISALQKLPLTVIASPHKAQFLPGVSTGLKKTPSSTENPTSVNMSSLHTVDGRKGVNVTSESLKTTTVSNIRQTKDFMEMQMARQPNSVSLPQSDFEISSSTVLTPSVADSLASVSSSTAAAAAAMVSLSTTNPASEASFFEGLDKCSAPDIPKVGGSGDNHTTCVPTKQTPSQFLIPSCDGKKLVISPAGIEHLQSLLKKQGISEGYFVITSPRTLPKVTPDTFGIKNKTYSNNLHQLTPCDSDVKPTPTTQKSGTQLQTLSMDLQEHTSSVTTQIVENSHKNTLVESKETTFVTTSQPICSSASSNQQERMSFDTEESESENSVSSESRSSPAALVIETGEDDEKMETERSSDFSSEIMSGKEENVVDNPSDIGEDMSSPDSNNPPGSSSRKGSQDTSWEPVTSQGSHENCAIPQSPLSLSDLVKQHQKRSFSRHQDYTFLISPESESKSKETEEPSDTNSPLHLASADNHNFAFPMPVCSSSNYGSIAHQQQNADTELQASFQSTMYSSSSIYSNDLTFESNVQHPGIESHISQTVRDTQSRASPKILSNAMSATSPKSPLSVNSGQVADQGGQLNPPMTPNTMLINLLNRVPTPLLTNHLLAVSTSQDNAEHNTYTATNNFDIAASNKNNSGMFPGKSLSFPAAPEHTHLNPSQSNSENLLFDNTARSLSNDSGNFGPAQNALELVAASYETDNTRNETLSQESGRPTLQPNFSLQNIASKTYDQASYSTHCGIQAASRLSNYSQSYVQEPEHHKTCHNFHCKSCSSPLVVTVNLDSEAPTCSVILPQRDEQKAPENILENYGDSSVLDQSLNLHNQTCIQEGSDVSTSVAADKCGDTEILKSLILYTSSSTFPTSQQAEVHRDPHFDTSASAYNLSQNGHPAESQFQCRVESFLEPENQHKDMTGGSLNQNNSYSTQTDSFLQLEHVHTQPGVEPPSSFDSANTSYKSNAFPGGSHQTYENTQNGTFSENNGAMANGTNSTYIMQTDMTNDTSFNVQDMNKNTMAMHQDFLESDERLQHINEFRSGDHQNEMFYQHSHSQQPDLHHQQNLHHFDPTNPHQGHDLDYHLDALPSSHHVHQYSGSSLSHPDSSRMYSDHTGSVSYMDNQYQSQFYDTDGVALNLPIFSQQCAVGSEAPVLGSTANHPCNIPFSSAPTGLQLEFRFPPEEDDNGNSVEKQPVLPSASFSPPSVADQAATPDPGVMGMYNGTFPNMSVYDMYMRGGNSDARGAAADNAPESGNFCVECNIMYKAQCKFHSCDYTYVSDTPILSHARLTLPACLKLSTSSVVGHINNTGVFAKEKIAVRTKFGPLIGSPVSCDKLDSTRSFSLWQTFTGTSTKVMGTSDENSSNWLMFVKPARVSAEQNLVAFQHGSSVYFVTRLDIEPGQELLYWFAKDYARMLGITAKPKNAHHQLCPHCAICKQVFPDRKQVRSHTRLQHPKPCTKKCSHCSRRFSQVSHLNAHITSVHLHLKKFVCSHCGKRFSDSSNFRKHVKSHSDERCFKCQLCGKDFRQKAHLKHHMNTHMPVKNEQCGYCGERFTRAFTRKQHELQHTKQNKIQCAHCDKIFYKQQVYKQHLKIHRNERNYPCTHCNKAFRTKANLTRHGPTCKQRKCAVIPPPPPVSQAALPPPPPSASAMQTPNFLHSNHNEVSITGFGNETKNNGDRV